MRDRPRTGVARGPERRARDRRRGARLKPGLLIAAAVIAVLATQFLATRGRAVEGYTVLAAPPEELVGTWVTEDPQFEDRAFVIANDYMELHLGAEGGIQPHPIVSIGALQGGDGWTYDITYQTSQGERTMTVHLHMDGVLRLRNPAEVVWRRQQTN